MGEYDGAGAGSWRGGSPDEGGMQARLNEALSELGLSALEERDLDAFMSGVVARVAEALDVEYCKVLDLRPDDERLLLRAGYGWKSGLVGSATVGIGLDSQAGYTMMADGPVIVKDFSRENRFNGPALLREHGVVSGISTTIYVDGHIFGVLGAHTGRRRSFSESEAEFFTGVARLLGSAIERSLEAERDRLVIAEQTERASAAERRFEFLAEANSTLAACPDFGAVLDSAARLVIPALADLCCVDVVEDSRINRLLVAQEESSPRSLARELRYRYPLDPAAPHGTPKVLRSGQPELIPEVSDSVLAQIAADEEHLGILRQLAPGSYMCVPLKVRGATLGALVLFSSGSERSHGSEDLTLAEGLAHCIALALDDLRGHLSEVEVVRELIKLARDEPLLVPSSSGERPPELTTRQSETLRLLAAGKTTREIARELYLSEATVRNHVRAILLALGAHSQLEALARARELGMLGRERL